MTNAPSPAASDSSHSVSTDPPQTPTIPGLPLESPVPTATSSKPPADNAGGVKRTSKPGRRANTAERRATHNAVERQRRETLNGRFVDLAGLLPNLSQIRKPSKSAIVNSSIAHLNASKRQRVLAAQQLRLLKDEADALRHEINQWRSRAGIQSLDEPRRADAFSVVLSGELEFDASDMLDGSDDAEEDEYGHGVQQPRHGYDEEEEYAYRQQQLAQQHQAHFAPPQPLTISLGPHPGQQPSPPHSDSPPHYVMSSPMIASPTAPVFDPSAGMVYDQHARQLHRHQMMLAQHQQEENDKWAYQQQHYARQPQGVW